MAPPDQLNGLGANTHTRCDPGQNSPVCPEDAPLVSLAQCVKLAHDKLFSNGLIGKYAKMPTICQVLISPFGHEGIQVTAKKENKVPEKLVATGYRVHQSVMTRLKIKAATEQTSVQQLIDKVVRRYLLSEKAS